MTFATFTSGLVTTVGLGTCLVVIVMFLALSYEKVVDAYLKYKENDPFCARDRQIKKLAHDLKVDCYWFSEHPEVQQFMFTLGETLEEQDFYIAATLRDRFRSDINCNKEKP